MDPVMQCALAEGQGLVIERLGLAGQRSWSDSGSPGFGLVVDGEPVADLVPTGIERTGTEDVVRYEHPGDKPLAVEWHVEHQPDLPIVETWLTVRNAGQADVTVERLDSIDLDLHTDGSELLSFTSGWGLEFGPVKEQLTHSRTVQSVAGRSSRSEHPYCSLFRPDGAVLTIGVVWSGNWVLRFEEREGGHRLSGGLHDEGFAKVLAPGESVEAPHVVLALGSDGDLDTTSIALARAARQSWAPRNELTRLVPVEWNHWWTYEDHSIDEKVFRANVDVAAELGVEVCTLDAGWFGPTDAESKWTDHRGDWDHVNADRFPSGIRALADYVHERGMRFGIWCEIEAVGPKATIAIRRPDFPAERDGERIGYVCFGNPDAAQWAYDTLDRLVTEGADWIKLDFNLDPGLGCDRTDHGHGPRDGLFEHYRGYYGVLTRMREQHPEVVLENCSSGGLRIDVGMLRQTHLTFLSDPDWPEHGLQLLWGASLILPPDQLLHWGFSEWYGDHRYQTFDPRDPDLAPHQLDYYRRIAMVGATGLSIGLPDLPGTVAEQLKATIATYKELVRPFVRTADLHRLTGQPQRFGEGDRWAGFQYSQPNGVEHLVMVFRLPGGEETRRLALHDLEPDRTYELAWLDAQRREERSGADLMDHGIVAELPEEASELIVLRRR